LQSADFWYMRRCAKLDGIRYGNENIKKSLQTLIGTKIPLHISQFTDENFRDMHRMMENKKRGEVHG
jgi:hypothetical protein